MQNKNKFSRIKNLISNVATKFKNRKKTAFIPLYNKIAEDISNGKLLTAQGGKYSKGTAYNYRSGSYRIKEYEKEIGTIYLEDIDAKWGHDFIVFQMNKGYAKNSISVTTGRLKAVLKRLYNQGISQYDGRGIIATGEQVTTVYSTIEDIRKLLDLDLSETTGMERVRDVYVLHCFSGLRFSDLKTLMKEPRTYLRDIGNKLYFEIKTQKTGEVVVIPVSGIAKQILDKYRFNFGDLFSFQYYNLTIKEIALKAGIDEEVVFSRTEGGVRKDKIIKKAELMSSHTARRTFATNAFLAGLRERDIMGVTGHKTTESFHKYIRCSNMESAIKIANHSFFNLDLRLTLTISSEENEQKQIDG